MRYIILLILISFFIAGVAEASSGFPGAFPGGFTTGFMNIGAVQKDKSGTELGFPGDFQGGFTTGYLSIGAVQRDVAVAAAGGTAPFIIWFE